jgi:hypothetical protein
MRKTMVVDLAMTRTGFSQRSVGTSGWKYHGRGASGYGPRWVRRRDHPGDKSTCVSTRAHSARRGNRLLLCPHDCHGGHPLL